MSSNTERKQRDPLGLSGLPLLSPDEDGWDAIREALVADRQRRARWRSAVPWMAAAASVLLVTGILHYLPPRGPDATREGPVEVAATNPEHAASSSDERMVDTLIATSQLLEQRLRRLREETTAMPAGSLVYVAELEDLIAQVDQRISQNPDSVDLWGQRVNLLLDLELIFQHHWEREYGRMASL